MRDPLDEYRQKRDFAATPEPVGDPASLDPGRAFVIHRHEARNLHYDLRLAHAGVLKSWAVPRGFSFDPAEKRLAVRTEDHPLAYEHFSGRIPKGQYGAGTMAIWDHGTFELVKLTDWDAAMAAGELKFVMKGRRLRGEWHLVRTQQAKNSWLLFKSRDVYAGSARDSALGIELDAAPAVAGLLSPRPMRCGGERAPFDDPAWLFEMEFAGQRCFATKHGSAVQVLDAPHEPSPALLAALRELRCGTAILDGVLVALDADGRPSRAALAEVPRNPAIPVAYYAFDLLQWEEFDLRPLPLLDRKAALRTLVAPQPHVLFVDHVTGTGRALAAQIAATGLPAAIAKRATSSYTGDASTDWQRLPCGGEAAPPVETAVPTRAPVRSRVRPTNLDKVYWPAEGFTKGDLLAYYHAVADALVPHLRDRPVHLNRFPDGIDGKSFYQREAKAGTPDWLRTVAIPHDGASVLHHVIDDRDALLYAVNLGSIDLHPWLSRVPSLDQPDYAVLDLDPKTAPFAHVVRIARATGKLLRGIGLRPLLKTSGKFGMHVFVPLRPHYTYDHTKMFAEAVARVLVRELPDIATVERMPDKRDGKVYLDFLQNRRSQTIVPPYCARPVRGASVSAPLAWDELEDADLSPQRFTIQSMPQRLRERGDLFRPALEDLQDLLPAIEALGEALRGR